MNESANPCPPKPPMLPVGGSETAAQIAAMVVLPIIVGGAAALANIAIIGLVAGPILLGGWVGCRWLALSTRHERPSLPTQIGISLVVAIGLFLLLAVCAKAAYLAGAGSTRYVTFQAADLFTWHVAAVGPAFLISWGQKLRADLSPAAWGRRLLYWFAYCPVSALAGTPLASAGPAPGA